MQTDTPHYVTSLISCHTLLFLILKVFLQTAASNVPTVLPLVDRENKCGTLVE
jgi:hypothetical protein